MFFIKLSDGCRCCCLEAFLLLLPWFSAGGASAELIVSDEIITGSCLIPLSFFDNGEEEADMATTSVPVMIVVVNSFSMGVPGSSTTRTPEQLSVVLVEAAGVGEGGHCGGTTTTSSSEGVVCCCCGVGVDDRAGSL